jgi:hypothetical protein
MSGYMNDLYYLQIHIWGKSPFLEDGRYWTMVAEYNLAGDIKLRWRSGDDALLVTKPKNWCLIILEDS